MAKPSVNYAVYLVTDSTPAILGDKDLAEIVEQAIRGGVTCVQYRDKDGEQSAVVAMAKRLHAITKKYSVPLLINDRVDVAAEIGCEGVHIGQDDMGIEEARKIVGEDKIIGISAGNIEEAITACKAGADYLGIGAVYATSTKKDTKTILGPAGVRTILAAMDEAGYGNVPTVCIGGVNAGNTAAVLRDSSSPRKSLSGVAVVSAIVAAKDPAEASRDLLGKVAAGSIGAVVGAVARSTPLSHNMTNLVVQNFAANVALAVGASPIMANYGEEAADLAKLGGALVVNMGTVTPEGLANYKQAIKAYNDAGRPILLDPVGAGATHVRRNAVKELLATGKFTVIKGNEGEIGTVNGATAQQRGVDSTSSLSQEERIALVTKLARNLKTVILMTGAVDVISDGSRTFCVRNGHEMLGSVTGTGCTLGTTVSAMLSAYPSDPLIAAVAGTVMFGVAAERAVERADVRGPGTFVPAFLDELYAIRTATAQADLSWLAAAKVEAATVAGVY